ncbi:MAG: hypothetical protein ACHQ7N_00630 [Candidatus Methylomirabilales bacterium]
MPASEVTSLVSAALQRGVDFEMRAGMLREDVAYRKIPADRRQAVVEQAIGYGREAAREMKARHGTADAGKLSAELGLQVVESAEDYVFGAVVMTSTYVHRQRQITLYTRAVAEMNAFLTRHDLVEVLGVADVGPLYLAHELFHHLEESRLGRAAKLCRVTTFRLGPFAITSGISQLSEIAADAFAQELSSLRFAPRLLDHLTVYIHNAKEGRRQLMALAFGRPPGAQGERGPQPERNEDSRQSVR